jgi:hypothetical protein
VEIACHGDTHDLFEGDALDRRVENMFKIFRGAGIDPVGFSPPYLFFDQDSQHLIECFEYLRIGHMERRMLFFPKRRVAGKGPFFVPVSGYSDYLIQEVGKEAYRSWLHRYLKWGVGRKQLLVFCLHPFIFGTNWSNALAEAPLNTWVAPLAEIVAWWRKREQWVERVNKEKENHHLVTEQIFSGVQEPEIVSRQWSENLAISLAHLGEEEELVESEISVVIGANGRVVVDNLGKEAKGHVEIDLSKSQDVGPIGAFTSFFRRTRITTDNSAGFNGVLCDLDPGRENWSRVGPERIRIEHIFEDELFGLRIQSLYRYVRAKIRNIVRGRPVNMGDTI